MDIYLIDGNSYVYRAYYAIRGLSDSRGRPTGAVFGFTNMLLKIIRDLRPDALAIAFDTPHKTQRHRLYLEYKAGRPGAPDEMLEQLPHIRKVIEAFRVKIFEVPGYEADDVIATIATRASGAGHSVYIVTADKDMLQLINGGVRVYDPVKNRTLGPEYVMERFGVPPERVPEFMAVTGDSVDNIPGVKGIGEKTARELFREFASLDEIIAHPERIKRARTRKLIEANIENVKLSHRLALIDRDVPLDMDPADFRMSEPDWRALIDIFSQFGFTSLMKYVPAEAPPAGRYEAALTAGLLAGLVERLKNKNKEGFSIRTFAGDGKLTGVSFCPAEGGAFYLPLRHAYPDAPAQVPEADAIETLRPVLEDHDAPKAGYDLKRDALMLRRRGVGLEGPLYDVLIAAHLLNPLREEPSLEAIALEQLSIKKETLGEIKGKGAGFAALPVDKAARFACYEAELVQKLKKPLFERIREEGLEGCYSGYEMPLIGVLAAMEEAGVRVDAPRLREFSAELEGQLEGIKKRIYFLAGGQFNINSPRQLAHVLFDVLKLTPGKRKKTGYSTEVGVLEELALEHELPGEVLDWRALFKLKTTYVDVLPALADPLTGRIHATFHQAATATGRLSSSDPNLQNIPIRGDWGRKMREAFIPEEGFSIIAADYSQIELRVLAHISGDETLKRQFTEGRDVHTMTAAEIFGIDPSRVRREHRRVAKVVNFGIVYGITPYGLARATGKSTEEAAEYIKRYFERHPGVAAYMKAAVEEAYGLGYVKTLSGRKRPIPELASRDRRVRALGERFAMNSPVQGTAADMIKKAMINLHAALKSTRTRMILQVHDELVFESPREEAARMIDIIKSGMREAAALDVPVVVEAGAGRNWAEAH
ncbi:MAG: DNA polymerase I [Nitrospiraceae bacterium]|nr:DNA polymerase I [Nitrospiraceae bacterium]